MELKPVGGLPRKKIMIVDDDPAICDVAARMLSEAGYGVVTVDNGDDVMEAAWDEGPDLVLLDCSLPGKPGLALLGELRASARFEATPIVMVTARRSMWSEKSARDQGANGYIRKPFERTQLLIAVAKLTRDLPQAA